MSIKICVVLASLYQYFFYMYVVCVTTISNHHIIYIITVLVKGDVRCVCVCGWGGGVGG